MSSDKNIGSGGGWQWRRRGLLQWVEITAVAETEQVVHGFTTRNGGFSEKPFDSLNLGYHVGDDPTMVLNNRRRLSREAGFELTQAVLAEQVHGANVARVNRKEAGSGVYSLENTIKNCDALITSDPGLILLSLHADCPAVFILDPRSPAIGLVHAGWRGTVQLILQATLEAMKTAFGTNAGQCLAGISPAAGPCCYAVGPEIIEKWIEEGVPLAASAVRQKNQDTWFFNLAEANRLILLASGLLNRNIYINPLCTVCNSDQFFSYRGVKGAPTGRMGAFIALRERP